MPNTTPARQATAIERNIAEGYGIPTEQITAAIDALRAGGNTEAEACRIADALKHHVADPEMRTWLADEIGIAATHPAARPEGHPGA